jgi:hypothetical protein
MEDYCKEVEDFINFALLNLKNISGGRIICLCVMYKKKKFYQLDVLMMHLQKKKKQKRFVEKYIC